MTGIMSAMTTSDQHICNRKTLAIRIRHQRPDYFLQVHSLLPYMRHAQHNGNRDQAIEAHLIPRHSQNETQGLLKRVMWTIISRMHALQWHKPNMKIHRKESYTT